MGLHLEAKRKREKDILIRKKIFDNAFANLCDQKRLEFDDLVFSRYNFYKF